MKPTLKVSLVALGCMAALVLGAGVAFADGGGARGYKAEWLKKMATTRIDSVLDVAKATAHQRQAVHTIKERVFKVLEENHQNRTGMMDDALALFEGNTFDEKKLTELRSEHEARARRVADAITQAIRDVHATLTPVQRKAVADYIRANKLGKMH